MDAGLRDLERDALSNGDPHAEARLLREKIRSGELNPHLVMAVASLEHPAACLVYPDQALGAHPFSVSLVEAGRLHVVRVLFAVTIKLQTQDEQERALINAVSHWLACPCREHKHAVAMANLTTPKHPAGGYFVHSLGSSVTRLRDKRLRAAIASHCFVYAGLSMPQGLVRQTALDAILTT